MLIGETGMLNLAITDDASDPLYTSVAVSTDLDDFVVTSVAVYVDLTHFSRGHLEIVLTSPQGTASVLQPGMRPENTQLDEDERWKLLTVRSWGESPVGEWGLSIVDLKDGDVGACIDQAWTFKIDGFGDATCLNLESSGLCEDGVLDPYDQLAGSDDGYDFFFGFVDNGLLAEDACCACGGGTRTDDIIDQLRQWRLVIYGHSSKEQTGVPPTTPSVIPMDLSSVNPSSPPNYDPTSMPMFIPREKPTVPQLASNKIIESGAQCTHTKGSMFLVLLLLVLMCL
jgi:subtilisin-like proprotein convertase family protein